MPKGRYTVGARGTHGCSGFPVVSESGRVLGCHKTRQQARAQQSAIYVSESSKKYYEVDSAIEKCCPDSVEKAQGPCWEGYEMAGWKEKDGKRVPNCIPKDTKKSADDRFEIRMNHPKCEGVALVEIGGTSVLCYPDRAAAEAALADMRREEPEGSVRPDENNKFWEGSFAPIR